MKSMIKWLVGIAIIAVIAVVVYSALPEFSHNMIRSYVQKQFQPETQAKIQKIQKLEHPKLKKDYKTILETNTGNSAWVYDADTEAGTETVTFYGDKVSLNLTEIPDHDGMIYSYAKVKVVFYTNEKGMLSVKLYLNGEKEPQPQAVKTEIFRQMLNGSTTN